MIVKSRPIWRRKKREFGKRAGWQGSIRVVGYVALKWDGSGGILEMVKCLLGWWGVGMRRLDYEGEIQLRLPRRHGAQQYIVETKKRFNVVCCGRRFGKDVLGIDLLIDEALNGKPVAWLAPTYKNLTEDWRKLVRTLEGVTERKDEQQQRLELMGGGVVECWSLDRADTVRGRAYGRLVINEAASVEGLQDIWEMVLRPTLTDYVGDAWFLSTPRGFNYFKVLFDRGQDEGDREWKSWRYPSRANPHISLEEIESARRDMDGRVYAQEYEASFLAAAGCLFDVVAVGAAMSGCRKPLEVGKNGGLLVWQRPVVGKRYVVGADVAEGIEVGNDKRDYSSAAVYDWQTGVHVASLHGQWGVDIYAKHLDELGRTYNNALLGVERNNHGHAVLLVLRQLGYPSIYEHRANNDLASRQGRGRYVAGWPTNAATKPVMEQELASAILSGSLVSWDEKFWDECLSYVQNAGGHSGAQVGCHDDRVVAHMIAWQMRHHFPMVMLPISVAAEWTA